MLKASIIHLVKIGPYMYAITRGSNSATACNTASGINKTNLQSSVTFCASEQFKKLATA